MGYSSRAIAMIILLAVCGSEGFLVAPGGHSAITTVPSDRIARMPLSSDMALSMAPKKEPMSNEGTNQVDWGKIAGMFVNPLNPYAWFVYFFVGINVFGYFNQS